VAGAGRTAKSKTVKLGAAQLKLAAGAPTKLRIKLGKARAAIIKAVLAHKRVTVSFSARAKAPDGTTATAKLRFRLK
jgi:hypothetical protein